MKNHIITFLISLLVAGGAVAQDFAPVGAKWHYTQYEFIGTGVSFTWFESVADTIVAGIPCRKIIGESSCSWQAEFVYDSNDSVFYYHETLGKFCLLFDMGAEVGESWTVYHYPNWGMSGIDSTKFVVDSLSEVVIDDRALRVLHISVSYEWESWWWSLGDRIIERIGGAYLFPVYGGCDPGPGQLRCYEDSVISLHQGPYTCEEIVTSIDDASTHMPVTVYPNPCTDAIHVQLGPSRSAGAHYALCDAFGKVIMQGEIPPSETTFTLATRNLPLALYVLSIYDDSMHTTIRVVKF